MLELGGYLDAYTASNMKKIVQDFLDKGEYKFVMDLEQVVCIDSVGAGILLTAQRKSQEKKGKLCLILDKSKVKRFFELTGLDRTFTILKNKRQICNYLSSPCSSTV